MADRYDTHPLAADLEHVLAHTKGVWEALRGQRILLTGGTGFFGTWLLESYLRAWSRYELAGEILVLTRNPDAFRCRSPRLTDHPAVRLTQGDHATFEIPRGPLFAIIHTSLTYGDPQSTLLANLAGMENILNLAVTRGTSRVLFTSSGAVYGPQPPEEPWISETSRLAPDPTLPISAYGEMKRACELLGCTTANEHGFAFTIARCFTFAGPHLPMNGAMAFPNFISDALNGGPIHVNGDGTTLRSYLYAADLSVWLWHILLRGESGRPYNVGSDEVISVGDLAQRIAAQAGDASVRLGKTPIPHHPPERYVPSIERARRELGLVVRVGLDEAIGRTLTWNKLKSSEEKK